MTSLNDPVELVELVELVRNGRYEEPFGTSSREGFRFVPGCVDPGSFTVLNLWPSTL